MEEIIDMVIKGTTNLGIICVNEYELAYYKRFLQLNNLEYIIKEPERLKVIVGNKNPLAKQEFIDNTKLQKQTIVVNNANNYHSYYSEKYNLVLGHNIVRLPGGLNQLIILNKIANSYLLSLPFSEETLKKFNCKSIDYKFNGNEWRVIFIYKNTTTLTEKELKLIEKF